MSLTDSTLSFSNARLLFPGILTSGTVAASATFISEHYGAPVMLMALLIGMALHFLSVETKCASGIDFTASTFLRFGVALLGARVTVDEIGQIGITPVLVVIGCVIATILFGIAVCRLFNRSIFFGILTSGSVAICGASAALAISCTLPKNSIRQQDTLLAVIAVTTLSTIAMIVYPIFFVSAGFSDQETAFLIGATIHDVAQVAGAGFAVSEEAGNFAVVTKLLRVSLLPVVVVVLSLAFVTHNKGQARAPFPWFVIAFMFFVLINSVGLIPPLASELLKDLSRWLLIFAIAAIGMKTSLQAIMGVAQGAFLLVICETVFLFTLATLAVVFLM